MQSSNEWNMEVVTRQPNYGLLEFAPEFLATLTARREGDPEYARGIDQLYRDMD